MCEPFSITNVFFLSSRNVTSFNFFPPPRLNDGSRVSLRKTYDLCLDKNHSQRPWMGEKKKAQEKSNKTSGKKISETREYKVKVNNTTAQDSMT